MLDVIAGAFILSGLSLFWFSRARRKSDVVSGLLFELESDKPSSLVRTKTELPKRKMAVDYGQDASVVARRRLLRIASVIIILLVLKILFFGPAVKGLLPLLLVGATFGYMFAAARAVADKEQYVQELEFQLPLLMERMVMAIQSGLDVLPALKALLPPVPAPLTGLEKLFSRVINLCEAGLGFETALTEIAMSVPSSAVRHAFIHLSLAYRGGGELTSPMRELSDATQLGYQESVEEQIAKLPVKATFPLVLTFAGLLICFLTPPMFQISKITKSAQSTALSAGAEDAHKE